MATEVSVPDRRTRNTLVASAALMFATLVALLVELVTLVRYTGDEASASVWGLRASWGPFAIAVLVQGVLTGELLMVWPKTRDAGLGVLGGTVATAVGLVLAVAVVSRS